MVKIGKSKQRNTRREKQQNKREKKKRMCNLAERMQKGDDIRERKKGTKKKMQKIANEEKMLTDEERTK